jgi:hypothetical protein
MVASEERLTVSAFGAGRVGDAQLAVDVVDGLADFEDVVGDGQAVFDERAAD